MCTVIEIYQLLAINAARTLVVMKFSNISIYFGYSVSLIASVLGIILVSGIAFRYMPVQMRMMLGVVMILLGIYRFVITRTKARQQSEDEED
jgi:uncharacterized membrane protein